MRLGGVFQGVGMVDRHVQLAVDDGGEQRVGAFQQFLARADIVVELRPGRKQRTVVVEFGEAKGGTGPEALPKLTNRPRGFMQDSEPGKVVLPTPS